MSTSARFRLRRWVFVLLMLLVFSVGSCSVVSYVSFYYPIKTDRYEHKFTEHGADRLTAYALLYRSNWRRKNGKMPVGEILPIVTAASTKIGVEPCLVHAVILYESGLNPNSISTTGAMGLMALQPATARMLSVKDPFDPSANVDGGTRLLKQLSEQFKGDVDLILAGYNAGPNAVEKFQGVPPYPETVDYVSYVGGIYRLCKANPDAFSAN
jgi:soluble lytic murein transglycosylase-like protein